MLGSKNNGIGAIGGGVEGAGVLPREKTRAKLRSERVGVNPRNALEIDGTAKGLSERPFEGLFEERGERGMMDLARV